MECIVEVCNRKPKAQGLCDAHYARFQRDGENFSRSPIKSIAVKGTNKDKKCLFDFCDEAVYAIGFCSNHYKQQVKHNIDFRDIKDDFEAGCAICGSFDMLSVDHDHSICPEKTACVKCYRGILCMTHNIALGNFRDNLDHFAAAIDYIEKSVEKNRV